MRVSCGLALLDLTHGSDAGSGKGGLLVCWHGKGKGKPNQLRSGPCPRLEKCYHPLFRRL